MVETGGEQEAEHGLRVAPARGGCPKPAPGTPVTASGCKQRTGLRHTRFGRNPRKAAQGILSALRTGRANPTSWKCRNSSLWSFGRWNAGTGVFSNGTSGTGSLTRYGTKPFTDGRCVCLRALMNAWLRKNGMKRSIRRLGAFQRYKGGVSCSTTSMSSIFTKSPLWSIAPLRQYRNLLRLQRRK